MKAYVYQEKISLKDLRLVERPDPTPGQHDIVLRMRAASLNYRDIAIERGNYHIQVAPPLVPLSDGAGEVIAVGAKVNRFRIGDLACPLYLPDWIDGPVSSRMARRRLGGPTDGVLTEMMCLNEEEAVRVPSHLDPVEAASLPVSALTAWNSLYRIGTVLPGDTVLVQGSGGISTAALQFARAGGAKAIAVLRDDRHEAAYRQLGAAEVLTNGSAADWPRDVLKLTGGVDVALNVAGGDTLGQSITATRVGGKVHLVGYASNTVAGFDIFEAIRRATTIHIATAGNRATFEAMLRMIELHTIKPAIARTFPADQIVGAFEYLQRGGHFGKVVMTF
jgi:NADPH:quinone reductase-like Zn-dependent oxidoreductase